MTVQSLVVGRQSSATEFLQLTRDTVLCLDCQYLSNSGRQRCTRCLSQAVMAVQDVLDRKGGGSR